MRAQADPPKDILPVALTTMKRKHVRDVLGIERLVYPRPWSAALFFSEIAQKSTRTYLVAYYGEEMIGYGGLIAQVDEGHITTLAVHPDFQGHAIGAKLLWVLATDAVKRGLTALALEVRVANWPAQRLYSWFGFRPVGVRRNYYAETGEDALVMWIGDLQGPEFAARLRTVQKRIGDVVVE